MSKLRIHITTSLDGYVAGPHQSEENPLGQGGDAMHDWAFELKAVREPHGMERGTVNASTPIVEEELANVGAEIMVVARSALRAAGPGEPIVARLVGGQSLEQARQAAQGKDVIVGGGADAAGLVCSRASAQA